MFTFVAEMVVQPPLAFNVVFQGVLVSAAKKLISSEVLIYTGGLKMHHIGSWCPGRHYFFCSRSKGVTAAVSLFVNGGTAMLSI